MDRSEIATEFFLGSPIKMEIDLGSIPPDRRKQLQNVSIVFTLAEEDSFSWRSIADNRPEESLERHFVVERKLQDDEPLEHLVIMGEIPKNLVYGTYSYDDPLLRFSDRASARLKVARKEHINITSPEPEAYTGGLTFYKPPEGYGGPGR